MAGQAGLRSSRDREGVGVVEIAGHRAEVVVVPVRDQHDVATLDGVGPGRCQRMSEPGVDEDARAGLGSRCARSHGRTR